MEFTLYNSRNSYSQSMVKAVIRKQKKSHNLCISISNEICKKLQVTKGDYVNLFISNENPKLFMVKKSSNIGGRKLIKEGRYLRFQVMWKNFEPSQSESKTNVYQYEITNKQELIIYFDKMLK